jgi:hypothetical protein
MFLTNLDGTKAFAHFRGGDLVAAEARVAALPSQSSVPHLGWALRVRQGRVAEADTYLSHSVVLQPQAPVHDRHTRTAIAFDLART